MLSLSDFNRLRRLCNRFVWLVLLNLCSCQTATPPSIIQEEAKLPQQVALGDADIVQLEKRLTEQKVNIISVGQDYLVSIPAANLFGDQSPQLTWESYQQLNLIACYLRQFRKVGVHVTGYTSRYVSTKRERVLSVARAEAVANYLWSQGVDARLLFTQGVGSDKPIVTSGRGGDKSPNARIEITFRRTLV